MEQASRFYTNKKEIQDVDMFSVVTRCEQGHTQTHTFTSMLVYIRMMRRDEKGWSHGLEK